ncbi:MAG TPA: sulfotransferase domain-containing protein [Anaerolineales bacterium]|nr:sulfotransferase domain-containing protein [Anaerolineales bacterium]
MNKLFSVSDKKKVGRQPIIVVSGLPRSGTSMMMRMLAEGGLPIITDGLRRADPDNPNGYLEFETVRQMSAGNIDWLTHARGKGVKVISALLEYLPSDYSYKTIFMEREVKEILASQRKMLDHRNEKAKVNDAEMETQIRKHLSVMKPWLVRQPNMEVLYVNYNALIAEPGPFCEQIAEFLDIPLNQARMLAVPNRRLYRNRVAPK